MTIASRTRAGTPYYVVVTRFGDSGYPYWAEGLPLSFPATKPCSPNRPEIEEWIQTFTASHRLEPREVYLVDAAWFCELQAELADARADLAAVAKATTTPMVEPLAERGGMDAPTGTATAHYRLWHRHPTCRGHENDIERCSLVGGYRGTAVKQTFPIDVPAATRALLEAIFARHNADDRPDGQTAPSLSVGDVVNVDVLDHHLWYRCERVGWVRIDTPSQRGQLLDDGRTYADIARGVSVPDPLIIHLTEEP